MKQITATAWRRMSGRKMSETLEKSSPLLVTSGGKPLYEVHTPGADSVQTLTIGQWKGLPGWDASRVLELGPLLIMRGKRPLCVVQLAEKDAGQ